MIHVVGCVFPANAPDAVQEEHDNHQHEMQHYVESDQGQASSRVSFPSHVPVPEPYEKVAVKGLQLGASVLISVQVAVNQTASRLKVEP